jgi:cytidine deaminase
MFIVLKRICGDAISINVDNICCYYPGGENNQVIIELTNGNKHRAVTTIQKIDDLLKNAFAKKDKTLLG